MEENIFIPKGLPLLWSTGLMQTAAVYRQAHALLAGMPMPCTERLRTQIEEGLRVIEEELLTRGIVPLTPAL